MLLYVVIANTILLIFAIFLVIRQSMISSGFYRSVKNLTRDNERFASIIRDESSRTRTELAEQARMTREELITSLRGFGDSVTKNMTEFGGQVSGIGKQIRDEVSGRTGEMMHLQRAQLEGAAKQVEALVQANEQRMDKMRSIVEERLKALQEDNSTKLEQMRATVDEKLHATLEQRLGESFKLVSERLELVHKSLGEMSTLASGVGDLKRVLSSVKSRGVLGEIQLGSILENIMTPDQYAQNVVTRMGSDDRVEFAVKLPAKDADSSVVWLPIDAKFPQEDYQRLLDAQDRADVAGADEAAKALEARLRAEAKTIQAKYIDPPHTTDFAVMFLPTESLYAEALRRPGLVEDLQYAHRVILTGPTILAAILNSLQMGFRTLAIERRSSEVWRVLGAVKTEFGRFGEMLDKTKKKLQEASKTIDAAAVRSRAIQRNLKTVEELPVAAAPGLETDLAGLTKVDDLIDAAEESDEAAVSTAG